MGLVGCLKKLMNLRTDLIGTNMILNAFEVTKDDILIVLQAHDTKLTDEQLEEVHSDLDIELIVNSCLGHVNFEDQTACMLAEIEYQMIASGMYITEPYRFPMPS
jgi:hypothetical protein